MSERIEVIVRFTVKKESVHGLFHNPQDFADSTAHDILLRLSAYEPDILEKSIKEQRKMIEQEIEPYTPDFFGHKG